MVGLEHPTFRLRGGDVTTSPPLPENLSWTLSCTFSASKNIYNSHSMETEKLAFKKNSFFSRFVNLKKQIEKTIHAHDFQTEKYRI